MNEDIIDSTYAESDWAKNDHPLRSGLLMTITIVLSFVLFGLWEYYQDVQLHTAAQISEKSTTFIPPASESTTLPAHR